jgi:hypothetical protein
MAFVSCLLSLKAGEELGFGDKGLRIGESSIAVMFAGKVTGADDGIHRIQLRW